MKNLVGVLFLVPLIGFSQQFNAEAPLPVVGNNGFYNIPLPPDVTSWLEPDLRNIRIVDENGKEVPYIIQKELPTFHNVEFIEYQIEKTQRKNCCTTLIILNKERKELNNIILEVRNAEIVKKATLIGSDDSKTWYALKDEFVFGNFSDNRRTSQLSILDFPLSNYSYYQVLINDSTTAPLNIVRAGYYNTSTDYGVYVEVPGINISQADSLTEHATYVRILFDTTQFIDKLDFEITGPQFYKRRARLMDKDRVSSIASFDIVSTHQLSIPLSLKAAELQLYVQNDNNPSLRFSSARAWQLRRSLTAWLEAGHTYKVGVGDSLRAPVYDLEFFRDSIPAQPPVLQLGEVTKFTHAVEATTPTYFTNRNIIWVAIAIVVIVLGVMSVRLLRENSHE
jgi:hypothetical protein